MSNTLKIIVTVLFIITFAGCSLFSRRYTKIYTGENRVMAKGKTGFKLDNSNGRIRVSHTDEPFIIIKYEIQNKVKKQEYEDASKGYSLKIDSTGNVVSVEAEEPEEHGFVFEHSFRANYEIFLPDGIDVSIDNINGNVIFNEMGNDLKADVANGSVDLQNNSGKINVEITNGTFNGTIDSTKGMNVEVVNGNIRMKTRKNFAGMVDIDIVHGKFSHEGIDFTKVRNSDKNEYGGNKEFHGDIGTSENKLTYTVTNGNVNIIALEKNQ